MWIHSFSFYSIQHNTLHHYSFWCSDCPRFGQSRLLKSIVYTFDMSLSVWPYLWFWFNGSLFCPRLWLSHFSETWFLLVKWALVIASHLSFLQCLCLWNIYMHNDISYPTMLSSFTSSLIPYLFLFCHNENPINLSHSLSYSTHKWPIPLSTTNVLSSRFLCNSFSP